MIAGIVFFAIAFITGIVGIVYLSIVIIRALTAKQSLQDMPFPAFGSLDETVKETTRAFNAHARGSVRISNMMFHTDAEVELLRKKAAASTLPQGVAAE